MSRALIFANGTIPDLSRVRGMVAPNDVLIAADGGTQHILALGLCPTVLIGDHDSLTAESREKVTAAGTKMMVHPKDKDETDLELAIHYATIEGYSPVIIVGALGGRFDQAIGNLSLMAAPSLDGTDIRADDGMEEVFFVRTACRLQGDRGDRVSLIPWGGKVSGVTTTGLRWPLTGEILWPYQTRGISNEMIDHDASISIEDGLLLVVHLRRSKDEDPG